MSAIRAFHSTESMAVDIGEHTSMRELPRTTGPWLVDMKGPGFDVNDQSQPADLEKLKIHRHLDASGVDLIAKQNGMSIEARYGNMEGCEVDPEDLLHPTQRVNPEMCLKTASVMPEWFRDAVPGSVWGKKRGITDALCDVRKWTVHDLHDVAHRLGDAAEGLSGSAGTER
ncbi:hypothetical protein DAEQUDRAFT_581566 [Daedalea quercina L-15889]|uniref:Uncharacterized protein n=1 Tax=Daedalea quercina L-15889 TaxID=1314783 RepID=A0A165LR66_9APHY|nr:hypothetical protein DAEQUDRAFT_581566 [Daedalea quercina L-15889]